MKVLRNVGEGRGNLSEERLPLPSPTPHLSPSQGYILALGTQIISFYFNMLLIHRTFTFILSHIFCHIFRFGKSFNRGNFLGVEDVLIVFQNHCEAGVSHELRNRSDIRTGGDCFGGEGVP